MEVLWGFCEDTGGIEGHVEGKEGGHWRLQEGERGIWGLFELETGRVFNIVWLRHSRLCEREDEMENWGLYEDAGKGVVGGCSLCASFSAY